MKILGATWPPILGLCLLLAATFGCAEGPFASMGAVNPWVRKRWAEEEQYGPTMQARLSELDSLRGRIARMPAAEQQRVAQDLSRRLRNEPNPLLRTSLVRTLAVCPSPDASEALRLALNDSDRDVRMAACRAWRLRGGPEALNALAGVVGSDTDFDVRMEATSALAEFRDPLAVQALGNALDDPNPALQYRAIQSLKTVSDHDFGDNLTAWREFARGGSPPAPQQPSLVERVRGWF